jgi:tetratricopeptide (TPR) repeat protein
MEGELEALQMFRELRDRMGEAICQVHLGQIALYEGDHERARHEFGQALAISREIAHHEIEGESELLLGEASFAAGDCAEAARRFAASLDLCRDAGDRHGEASATYWLGKTDLEAGDLTSARRRLGDALREFGEFEMREELVACLDEHVALMLREGRAEEAVKLAGAAAQARVRLALVRPPLAEHSFQTVLEQLRRTVEPKRFAEAWCKGQCWETKEAVSVALGAGLHAAAVP